jgi:hypothetical protein
MQTTSNCKTGEIIQRANTSSKEQSTSKQEAHKQNAEHRHNSNTQQGKHEQQAINKQAHIEQTSNIRVSNLRERDRERDNNYQRLFCSLSSLGSLGLLGSLGACVRAGYASFAGDARLAGFAGARWVRRGSVRSVRRGSLGAPTHQGRPTGTNSCRELDPPSQDGASWGKMSRDAQSNRFELELYQNGQDVSRHVCTSHSDGRRSCF